MPTVVQLRFPGSRYHATPWDAHVNEGRIEWPPSPWRILRALIATGYTKLRWPPGELPETARELFERLASSLPTYSLPPGSRAHTRHYVDAGSKKPLILDAWAHIGAGVMEVSWDVDLDEAPRALLAQLLVLLGYLGRAESWVEGRLVDTPTRPPNCRPTGPDSPGPRYEAVRVMCPMGPGAYAAWRARAVEPIQAAHAPKAGKRLGAAQKKKLAKALAPYPPDLTAALCVDTKTLRREGWSAPPGSRQVVYWRRADALDVDVRAGARPAGSAPLPLALLALATTSRGTSALPPPTRVYPQGRLLHRALASLVGREPDAEGLALSLLGQGPAGPAKTDHRHAHLLHIDLGGRGRLDHALLHTPMGLDARAQSLLRKLRKTYMKGGAGELQVSLVAVGEPSLLRELGGGHGARIRHILGPAGGARTWISATPYVAPRYLKRSGPNALVGQVRQACAVRGLPPVSVEVLDSSDERARGFRHYVLHDDKHRPNVSVAWALRLVFERPVEGPISLGYGCHAGLGRFEVAPTGSD